MQGVSCKVSARCVDRQSCAVVTCVCVRVYVCVGPDGPGMRCSFCVLRVYSIVSDYVRTVLRCEDGTSGSVHTAKPKAHLALRNWKRETERRGRGERLGKADDHVKPTV